jgi:hypothetical protein
MSNANILRDGGKKFHKFDRNLAENELFCGYVDFWCDKPPAKFDKHPRDE